MKLRNLLTAGLTAMALFTAGCVGGGDSANKMDTPKEGPVELQVSAAASLTDAPFVPLFCNRRLRAND